MFWRSKEADKKSKEVKETLIAEDTEYKEDNYRMWGDYRKGIREGRIEPFTIHTQSTLSSPSCTVNNPEYSKIEIEYNPSTRINNYFNSLSQDQCTKLINQFGKMLDEL